MSQIISVTMARPSEDEVKSLWQLFHATEAAEDRWHRESSEQFLERLGDQDISDEERTFIAVAWDSLVQGHGGFGRFMGAYDTLIHNFQDPDADHVATHPKFNALLTESALLPVVLEGYTDAKNSIVEIENERNAALNTCTLIAEALGITGAVAGDTIARVQQLVSENTTLTNKAASELSNAWLLHRTVMGAQAALFCITQGNLGQAREWLEGTTDEAQLEIPDGMDVNGLQHWFDENMVDHITHAKAVEIIKTEITATTRALNEIKAQSRIESTYFTANRLLAAFEHGFIDKPEKEVADIALMILESAKYMPSAQPEEFTKTYSDQVLARIAANLRGKQNA
ncbi:hypothetical protein [Yersinia mollaretii]|uniref:hypothetical protein n=1 Tax=Yersinia mollaretii TaxID=33060 RepID=UPI00119EE9B8|nr:hypothetical protein [Yersinia mollaretii]